MSEPKEANFFNDIIAFRTNLKPNFQRGLKWYKLFFNHCTGDKLKGEITNSYGIDTEAAIRIRDHNPNIRILFCLRNPVDRIWSHYQFARFFEGKEDRHIEVAIKEEKQYLRMSSYFQTLSMYLNHFSKDQIFLIWFEDIQNRPAELLRETFSFLGVDPGFIPKMTYKKSNQARISRFVGLQSTTKRINLALVRMGFSGLIKKLKMAGLGNLVMKANSRPLELNNIPEEIKKYILSELDDDIQNLEKLTRRDLSHWRR